MKNIMKKIFNFLKNNIFLFFSIYWFVEFAVGCIKFNPSSLDETTRRIKALVLSMDLIWSLIFTLEHVFYKIIKFMGERIDSVNRRVDIICDAITEAINAAKEEKNEDENGKEKQS